MTTRKHQIAVLLVACSSLLCSLANARLMEPTDRELLDTSSFTNAFKDFFTDERCLRTEKNTANLVDLSNWMSKLENADITRFRDITLPGTHNSASFDLTTDINRNDPDYQVIEEGTFNIPENLISQWICGYALTQSLSLSEQLQAGVRYLDLRFDFDSESAAWRSYHFLFGLGMTELLEQISVFAKTHPKEIIVVEFGTIYNPDVTAEQKADYQRKITNTFAGNLISTATDLDTVTIAELQAAGTNILAVVRDDEVAAGTDILWNDQTAIFNTYVKTDNVDVLAAYNNGRLTEFYNHTQSSLYKIQWLLTPSSDYIKSNPLNGNLYNLAQNGNAKLRTFKGTSTDGNKQLGNILVVDYVEVSPLITLLELGVYSDGAFVEEEVEPQSMWTVEAKIGVGVGVLLLLCGCCCLRKWCKGRKK